MTRSCVGALLLMAIALAGCATSAPNRPVSAPVPGQPAHVTSGSAPLDWPVPPEAAARKNPLTATSDNLDKGQRLFNRYCTACHGVSGRGDGPVAQQWPRLPKDLTHPERQARMTDGEIFWRISSGHREGSDEIMPTFGERLGDDDRWRIVLYVRALGRP